MTTSPYKLADDVFWCLSDSRMVFLDLRRNQYLCLNQRNTQVAVGLFSGLADSAKASSRECSRKNKNAQAVVKALTDRGLLAQEGGGREAALVRIQTPESSLLVTRKQQEARVHARHWTPFFYASIKASFKLRFYSIRQTVRSIESRKKRDRSQVGGPNAVEELVAIFHHLRPYYARKYLCLFDSLALVEFLAQHRVFPRWVFGVRVEPFAAHCWIQDADCVLNDTAEYVRSFTPIMAV